MNRVELIEQARDAYEKAGRGMNVNLIEDKEPRYVPIAEANELAPRYRSTGLRIREPERGGHEGEAVDGGAIHRRLEGR